MGYLEIFLTTLKRISGVFSWGGGWDVNIERSCQDLYYIGFGIFYVHYDLTKWCCASSHLQAAIVQHGKDLGPRYSYMIELEAYPFIHRIASWPYESAFLF